MGKKTSGQWLVDRCLPEMTSLPFFSASQKERDRLQCAESAQPPYMRKKEDKPHREAIAAILLVKYGKAAIASRLEAIALTKAMFRDRKT